MSPMDALAPVEYQTLRQTISVRGSLRPPLFLAGMGLWAAALLAVLIVFPNPVASAIPLLMLVSTFEALRVLNSGVERIGRYVQVFFEREADAAPMTPPAWEHTAMRIGGRVPGAAGHPLFLPIFLMATLVNLLAVLLPGPMPVELVAMGGIHLAFIVWALAADRAVRTQRARELDAFERIRQGAR